MVCPVLTTCPCFRSPWDDGSDSVDNAKKRVDAAFEFFDKLGKLS